MSPADAMAKLMEAWSREASAAAALQAAHASTMQAVAEAMRAIGDGQAGPGVPDRDAAVLADVATHSGTLGKNVAKRLGLSESLARKILADMAKPPKEWVRAGESGGYIVTDAGLAVLGPAPEESDDTS